MPQTNFPWTGNEAPAWDDIKNKPTTFAPIPATTTVVGGVKVAAHQANAAGANPTKAEYDALLAALVAAGIMAAS